MHGVLIVYIIRLLNIVICTHTYYMCKILKCTGGPIGDQLRHELNELREKMRIEVSSHEALRHRLGIYV